MDVPLLSHLLARPGMFILLYASSYKCSGLPQGLHSSTAARHSATSLPLLPVIRLCEWQPSCLPSGQHKKLDISTIGLTGFRIHNHGLYLQVQVYFIGSKCSF